MVSTLLLTLAAGIVVNRWAPGWLRGILEILIFLDFVGTGAAAYFLEDWILLGLMIVGLLAWIAHLIRRPTPSLAT